MLREKKKSLFSVQSGFICGFRAAFHQTHLDEVLEGKENFTVPSVKIWDPGMY